MRYSFLALALASGAALAQTAAPTPAQFNRAMAEQCPAPRAATRAISCRRAEEGSVQFSCSYELQGANGAWARHSSLPSARLYAIVYSLPLSKAVRTSRLPTIMGDEAPLGTATFHFRFLSGPIATGGLSASAMPEAPGPRNCGHGADSPCANAVQNIPTNSVKKARMLSSLE